MRLISCHIEGFGVLEKFDLDFKEGLHSIKKNNGWGKSTLAAFLRVMFFGFENETKRDEISNERKRYCPWKKITFGGTLTFEVKGKKYRMERFFDEKKPAKDTFFLFDAQTNLKSTDYSEKIGEEIFQIDRESFKRTIFIGQSEVETFSTPSIHAKIGNISDQAEDLGNYERAEKRLKEEENFLTPDRKTGEIHKIKTQISELYRKNSLKEAKEKEIFQKNQVLKEYKERKQKKEREHLLVLEKIKKRSKYDNRKVILEKRKDLEERIANKEEEIRSVKQRFKAKIPTMEEVESCVQSLIERDTSQSKMSSIDLKKDEKLKKGEIERQFKNQIPQEDDFIRLEKEIKTYRDLLTEQRIRTLSKDERERYSSLEKKYKAGVPRDIDIDETIKRYSEVERCESLLERDLELLLKKTKELEDAKKKIKKINWIVLSILLIGSLYNLLALLYDFLFLPVLWMGLLFYNFGSKAKRNLKQEVEACQKEILKKEKDISEGKREVEGFLTGFGIKNNENPLHELYKMKGETRDYSHLSLKYNANEQIEQELYRKEASLKALFAEFGTFVQEADALETILSEWKHRVKEWKSLVEREKNLFALIAKKESYQAKVDKFFLRYEMEKEDNLHHQLSEIRDSMIRLSHLEEEKLELGSMVANHKKEHPNVEEGLEEPEVLEPIEELNLRLSELAEDLEDERRAINDLSVELMEGERELEDLQNDVCKIKDLEEERDRLLEKYRIITLTKKYLEEAKNKFVGKYMLPIKRSFDQFYSLLTTDEKRYELNANLEMFVKEEGTNKDLRFLSEGYRDLVGLGRRMSFVEAMYQEEKPFLILDDPFANFDEEKTEMAIEFLKKLSKEYQILYFCCHTSREVLTKN